MSSPDRRHSAEELDRLIEQVRRDPGSSAFVALGEAYLRLGRPRDAVEAGVAGLRAAPDGRVASDGRVMVARALAALHQWKEAQAELLKVVKVDRNHGPGFALLGEVLLRRGDHERALPVLQHAQNLDPSNPAVLAMLRRARAGQPLDPPPPIPTAAASGAGGARAARPSAAPPRPAPPRAVDLDDAPTHIGGPHAAAGGAADLRGDPTEQTASAHDARSSSGFDEMTGEITSAPARGPRPGDGRAARAAPPAAAPPDTLRRAARPSAPPPMGQVAQAAAAMQAGRDPSPAPAAARAAPAAPAGAVRPRVIGGVKQHNPAAAALRASAAAGENYLNDLLTGGLLEVPGVRVPDVELDVKPDRRWGRSAGRLMTVLFVLLVMGAGAGVGWYLHTEKSKAAAIARHRDEAARLVVTGHFADLERATRELASALERGARPETFADVAHVTGLMSLLYGTPTRNTDDAIAAAARDLTKPEQEGWRALAIARASVALATLASESDADTSLAKARAAVEEYLAEHGDDRWARWLQARAMLAAGERAAARGALASAADGEDGIIPAMVDLADLLVDDGKLDEAQALYARALGASPGHPLALVGQILAWAERGAERDQTLAMLNVDLPEKKNYGRRVRAYRQLALALARYHIEEYEAFDQALAQAIADGPSEPRYLGRVALARLLAGDFATAARARAAIAWFGKAKPESDPVVALFDAALLVESGLPARALTVLGGLGGTRAHLIRAQALLDLGATEPARLPEALAEAERALAGAPDNAEAAALVAWARVVNAPAKEREALLRDLNGVANRMLSKRGRHVEGAALLALGAPDARLRLDQALAEIDPSKPNPIAYRTHTLLARLDLAEATGDTMAKKLEDGLRHVEAALTANGGYLPALVVGARLRLRAGDPEGALAALAPVLGEAEAVTWEVELAHAEALAARPRATADDRARATEAVRRARAHGAPAAEVGRVAALVDPDLPDKLGVPAPGGPVEKSGSPRRRRR